MILMAFNWQTFKTRTLTAAIFVVVMLAGLLINRWTFFVLFSIIHFGCWWEYLKLVEKIYATRFNRYLKMGFMVSGYGLMILLCSDSYVISGYGLKENFSLPVSVAGFILLVAGIFQKTELRLKSFFSGFIGLLYISLSVGLLINLYGKANVHFTGTSYTDIHLHDLVLVAPAYFYPISIIASLWINDTMAYIVGSFIGRTQMSKLSPKKTWEGTIGGIIFCVAVIFLLSQYIFHLGIFSYELMVLAAIVSITGTIGDLFESKLKRMAGVKDSGHIMPGHGGFLDRFDSLLFATPFVWLYVYFFMAR
jgi:phosphatidate cytidylyltransferase